MRLFFFLFLFLFSSSSVFAVEKPVCSFIKNGMRVCLLKSKGSNVVFHSVIYSVGGGDDPRGRSGAAHFLEHIMFGGTKRYKDIPERMSELGANYNAFTGSDFTAYYEIVKLEDLNSVMDIESDRMQHALFTEERVEKERNIILEERLMSVENSPFSILFEEMRRVFHNGRYATPIIGWKNEINSISAYDLRRMYKYYYSPKHATLFVIGDLDFDKFLRTASKYYGVNGHGKKESMKREFLQDSSRNADVEVRLKHDNAPFDLISVVYRAPGLFDDKESYRILNLLSLFLAGDSSGKLYDDLVISKKVAKSVHISYSGLDLCCGSFAIEIVPQKGKKVEEVVQKLDDFISSEMRKISVSDINSMSKAYSAKVIFGLNTLLDKGVFYANHFALGIYDDILPIYSDVKVADSEKLENLIKNVFSSKRVVGYLLKGARNEKK